MDNELFIPNSFTNSLSDLNINNSSFKDSNHKTKKRKAPLELSPQLSFKKRINYYIHFFDNHSTLFSFTKILIGLIFLTTPTLMIILYPYYSSLITLRYYMLPFIISVALSSGFLIIFIMNRIVSSLIKNSLNSNLKDQYHLFIKNLRHLQHTRQYRQAISEIEKNYPTYESLQSEIYKLYIIKAQCILKILSHKLTKYTNELINSN